MGRRVIAALIGALFALVPVSAASARTASVRSFDGTAIHVNFFTAVGLAPGKRVPTVLLGPGW
jgi:ABC-2 type transport system ATP-binding protein